MALRSNSSTASNVENVQLYNVNNWQTLPWHTISNRDKLEKYLSFLVEKGANHYINNIRSDLSVIVVDDKVLPITINEAEQNNCYVCSPLGHYVTCAQESLFAIPSTKIQKSLKLLLKGMRKVLTLGNIDRTVIVNNWLFSTDLHPKLTHDQIRRILLFLKSRFPQHAIIFRSLNKCKNQEFFQTLRKEHFKLLASREVYLLQAQNEEIFKARIFKSDFKLMRESGYEIIYRDQITGKDLPRLQELYEAIYLKKHTMCNPQLNHNFFELMLNSNFLEIAALKRNGTIDAFVAFYIEEGVMMAPMLGYDVTKSSEIKLYRLASTLLALEARKRKMLFNLSSGASFFKRIRRGECHMEYMAVHTSHLPFKRKLPWIFLKSITNGIGILAMKVMSRRM